MGSQGCWVMLGSMRCIIYIYNGFPNKGYWFPGEAYSNIYATPPPKTRLASPGSFGSGASTEDFTSGSQDRIYRYRAGIQICLNIRFFWFQKINGTLNPLTLVQCTFLQSEKATSTYIQPVGSGGVPKNIDWPIWLLLAPCRNQLRRLKHGHNLLVWSRDLIHRLLWMSAHPSTEEPGRWSEIWRRYPTKKCIIYVAIEIWDHRYLYAWIAFCNLWFLASIYMYILQYRDYSSL